MPEHSGLNSIGGSRARPHRATSKSAPRKSHPWVIDRVRFFRSFRKSIRHEIQSDVVLQKRFGPRERPGKPLSRFGHEFGRSSPSPVQPDSVVLTKDVSSVWHPKSSPSRQAVSSVVSFSASSRGSTSRPQNPASQLGPTSAPSSCMPRSQLPMNSSSTMAVGSFWLQSSITCLCA